ncbi:DNA topoisomerase IB [Nocardia sputorum]|uniref:DNA topoisomerase n=1 Tax=Nocardia sputorum TaxID=2984338 RepID=A0ABM8CW45_9NOCA|nr:DNA topoisomerase IB [Nocardia sputorum]BDT99194.1 DNA topoisomerase [Nocardia sputorum]
MRLRRSRPYDGGVERVRRGRGFSYRTADGAPVRDDETLERIRGLAIPPAWRKVWICPHDNGHIQAVGVDAAGRRQYLYHEQWRKERDEEKFDRVLALAGRLPEIRAQVREDLALRGLTRPRVEAVAVDLVDRGVFRVGGEEYAEEHGTRGVATLLREQVEVSGDRMLFDYLAKGGIRRRVSVRDALLAKAVRSLLRSKADSDRLLVYRDGSRYGELRADDINSRFRELAACECSVKDLRTWQATVLAAAAFGSIERPAGRRARRTAVREVMDEVAAALGNTPAVAQASYVDPRVVTAFENGTTVAAALRRAKRAESADAERAIIDSAVIRMLRRM